ncbi:MAG: hypothetical protein K0S07_1090 [Chlamydiales bacterium]|jgi:spore maturation protein CgeB|nr:hypothetical protein [Chlamydiales bacterium]
MQRILFLVHNNQYDSKRHFTKHLMHSLQEKGVECQLIDTPHGELSLEHLKKIEQFRPDLLASFSLITAGLGGGFISDELQIPHLSFVLDSVAYVLPLTGSDYSWIASVDANDVDWLESKGFQKSFFFPHAAAPVDPLPFEERPLDAVFIGSCYDFLWMRSLWPKRYPDPIPALMEDAAEEMRISPSENIVTILFDAFSRRQIPIAGLPFLQILEDVDYYMRGKDRLHLIESLAGIPISIFGAIQGASSSRPEGWSNLIRDLPHVTWHPPISYEDSLQVIKNSRICLNSCPSFKRGGHERLFAGLAASCLTVTNRNLYTEHAFSDGEDILLYDPSSLSDLADSLKELLAHPKKGALIADAGRSRFLEAHTFDRRADLLLQELPLLQKNFLLK